MHDLLNIGQTKIRLAHGDITRQVVDAIVNAANSTLLGGGGVDGAIHQCGGPAILEACRTLRTERYPDGLPPGEAVATTAGNLPAGKVIHTVGPIWAGGHGGEAKILEAAYRNSLTVAADLGLRTIAFPAISTGVYGYPIIEAAMIALKTIVHFAVGHPGVFDEIRVVLFSQTTLDTYRATLKELAPRLSEMGRS